MTEKFVITGMTCAACAAHVERAAASVPGVHSASVNQMLGSLVCDRDENVDPAAIVAAVTAAGYGAVPESEARRDLHAEQDAAVKAMGRRLLWSVVCLVPLFYLSMGHMMGLPVPMFMHTRPLLSAFVLLVLTVPILILNRSYFTVGFSRLFKGAPNMDSLVALGAAAGLVYSLIEMGLLAAGKVTGMPDLYFESAGMILALVTVGKYLEERSKGKTTGAITALLALAPGRQRSHRPHRGHQGRRDGHRPAGGAYPRGRHRDGGQRHRGRVRPYRREYAGGEDCGRQGGVRHHPHRRLSGADGGPGRCGYHSVPDHSADGAGRQRQGTYQPSGG